MGAGPSSKGRTLSNNAEDRLAQIELFAGLSKRQLKKLVSESREVHHDAGHRVAEEGLGALAFHLVLDGEAAVQQGGRTLRTLGPGDYFGEMSIIDGKPRSASVEATSALTTLAVPHQSFQTLLHDDPAFARSLLVMLCGRLREAEARHS